MQEGNSKFHYPPVHQQFSVLKLLAVSEVLKKIKPFLL